mmetsp:Transcript_17095/g.56665  ORF Transcript_17095/g.56665 Transcript_17095/m.56665 type:complete len:221 (-) Transcript_17095:451-1113(-)
MTTAELVSDMSAVGIRSLLVEDMFRKSEQLRPHSSTRCNLVVTLGNRYSLMTSSRPGGKTPLPNGYRAGTSSCSMSFSPATLTDNFSSTSSMYWNLGRSNVGSGARSASSNKRTFLSLVQDLPLPNSTSSISQRMSASCGTALAWLGDARENNPFNRLPSAANVYSFRMKKSETSPAFMVDTAISHAFMTSPLPRRNPNGSLFLSSLVRESSKGTVELAL